MPAGSWTLPNGSAVGPTVDVQPFRSVVLVTSAAVSISPPYYAASGIDWRVENPVTSYLGDDGLVFAAGFDSGGTGACIVH